MTRLAILSLVAFVAAACSSGDTTVQPLSTLDPAPSSTGTPSVPDSGAMTTNPVDSGTTPAGPATFIGTLDATAPTKFGGLAGHCTYDVVLKNVAIEVDVNPNGQIIGGTASDTMDETLVGTCPNAALGTKAQTFLVRDRERHHVVVGRGKDGHRAGDIAGRRADEDGRVISSVGDLDTHRPNR